MSRIRYNWACPTCDAQPREHCRSLSTHRITDTHKAREAWIGIFNNDPPEEEDK